MRTGLPKGTWRQFYGGVPFTKSTTAQINEGVGMLEDYSRVDETCRNQYFRDVQFLIRAKTEENHLGES